MNRLARRCRDEDATAALGAGLALGVRGHDAPLVVWLRGPLGAGKTSLARAILRALGERGPVRSPTFTLLEVYTLADLVVLHLDLYRIDEAPSIEGLGLRDYDRPGTLWLIEWAEKGGRHIPAPDLVVTIEPGAHELREITLEATTPPGRALLDKLDTGDSCPKD